MCVELGSEAGKIIIDPLLSENPQADCGPDDIDVDAILLTHCHADHLGDTVEIAKRLDIPVIGTLETTNYVASQGVADVHAMHIGGTHRFDFGRVRLTTATHSNSTPEGVSLGMACGFVIDFDSVVVYYAGDTGLTLDMKLLDGITETVDVALLPIGGNFTMDVADAVLAAEFINPRYAIPMHYDTWPVIEADPQEFAKRVQCEAIVLEPGEFTEID